jgi:hypothetical protein
MFKSVVGGWGPPGCPGTAEQGIVLPPLLDTLRVHTTRLDRKNIWHQNLMSTRQSVTQPAKQNKKGDRNETDKTDVEGEDRTPLTVFFDATQDIVHVVREEPFGVKHRLDKPSDRAKWHLLIMRVLVPL